MLAMIDINRIDFLKTQELLLKLIQALLPLTEKTESLSSLLQQRFWPVDAHFYARHSIHPIKTLYSVQADVEKALTQASPEKPKLSQHLQQELPVSQKKRESSLPQPSNPAKEQPEDSLPKLPLALRAQRLINEVQDAIAKLCDSTYIKNPKEKPLLQTLQRLKPQIDEIVKEIASKEGTMDRLETSNTYHRLPRPIREHLIAKDHHPLPRGIERPHATPHHVGRHTHVGHTIARTTGRTDQPLPEKISPTIRGEGRGESGALPRAAEVFLGLWKGTPERTQQRIIASESPPLISGLPFTPETKIDPNRNKKRKAFWFKSKKEKPTEENNEESGNP